MGQLTNRCADDMNDKNVNASLLLAILITVLAVIAQRFFPEKRFVLLPNPTTITYFYATNQPDGSPAAFWLDEQQLKWRCMYPEISKGQYFACTFNALMGPEQSHGVDLRGFTHMKVKLNITGVVPNVRLFIRNFDPAYSVPDDTDSTKFQSVIINVSDLNKELKIDLEEFMVAEWWLAARQLSRELSRSDFNNVVSFGMDFIDGSPAGIHDVEIQSIEFTGGWIKAENWYLLILGFWMLGILSYTVVRMIRLNQQTEYDGKVIRQLNLTNEQLQQEKDNFRRLSTVDPLTQAYNRFGIDQIVSTLMICNDDNMHRREAPDFALIIIDIDHFKQINDTYGHDVGDLVLQHVSSLINGAIRPQDFLGRWGGEEFVVIMPRTSKTFAYELADRVRDLIAHTPFYAKVPLNITASFGVSEKQQGEDFGTTFKRADVALFKAKSSGRNVCVQAELTL